MYIEIDPSFAEPPAGFIPAPSVDPQDRLARLRLSRSHRVGPVTFQRLLADHGTASAALQALPGIANAAGIERYSICPEPVALAEMRAAKRAGAQMLCLGDAAYPALLASIPNPPPILWALGQVTLLQRPMIGIVGTRNASSLGARMARRLACELGEAGFVVVSGLARGIDALAHAAALETGTIGIHAGGLDVIYPRETTNLAQDMANKGLRLSEQRFGLEPQARDFPRRNRIVSGLCSALIVVEAAARSGSLITARLALDQGREVMAVPGHPLDTRTSGCNSLIRDGASLVRNATDVLEALGAPARAPTPPADHPLAESRRIRIAETLAEGRPQRAEPATKLHSQILAHLGPTPIAEDQLIRDLALNAQQVARELVRMEMTGEVDRLPGGLLSRPV
ncbi:MAG: DNA processing protein [Paracoccaceae bacterium]|jgi:DNA processing protein